MGQCDICWNIAIYSKIKILRQSVSRNRWCNFTWDRNIWQPPTGKRSSKFSSSLRKIIPLGRYSWWLLVKLVQTSWLQSFNTWRVPNQNRWISLEPFTTVVRWCIADQQLHQRKVITYLPYLSYSETCLKRTLSQSGLRIFLEYHLTGQNRLLCLLCPKQITV